MKIGKTLCFVVTSLALACAQAAPDIQTTLFLGNNTQGIATDPALAKAYVTNFDDHTVSAIDMQTLTVVATINVAPHPRRVIADSATSFVYVTNSNTPGTVTLIKGLNVGSSLNPLIGTIPVGNDPRGLGSNFLIGQVYVSNFADNSVSVISTATNSVVATIPTGSAPLAPNSNDVMKKMYVVNSGDNTVSVIDEQALAVIKTIPVGQSPINASIDAEHDKVYVNNATDRTISVISSATDTVIATLPSGAGGTGNTANFVTISGVYHRAYLPNAVDGTLTIIDTDTDTVTDTVTVGTTPVDTLVDANGGNVYVVNQGSNSVSILDAGTEMVIDSLVVGSAPTRIVDGTVFGPRQIFVLNSNSGTTGTLTIATSEDTLAETAIATEFYEADFDHYFHTAAVIETRLLEDGIFGDGWQRTFEFWRIWTAPAPDRLPVCRFFSTAFGAKSSHFYTPYPSECMQLRTNPALSSVWQFESPAVYYLVLTDASGNCPAGTTPLYRLYNNGMGGTPSHRYTTDPAVRAFMITQGWLPEGNGLDIIFACSPTLLSG